MDDAEIICRVKEGRSEDFSLLVEKYHRQLLSFIHKITGDPMLTEDLGQEVFLSVYMSLREFDQQTGTPFSAWLFIIARNKAITAIRQSRRRRGADTGTLESLRDPRPVPIQRLIDEEERDAFRKCLHQLDEPFRSTLIHSLAGESMDSIAVLESITLGTAKSRLHRGRKKLMSLIKDFYRGKHYG